jgi:hypothetical protein
MLLQQLKLMEESCSPPLNCDAIAYAINYQTRFWNQVFCLPSHNEMWVESHVLEESIVAAAGLNFSFGNEAKAALLQQMR